MRSWLSWCCKPACGAVAVSRGVLALDFSVDSCAFTGLGCKYAALLAMICSSQTCTQVTRGSFLASPPCTALWLRLWQRREQLVGECSGFHLICLRRWARSSWAPLPRHHRCSVAALSSTVPSMEGGPRAHIVPLHHATHIHACVGVNNHARSPNYPTTRPSSQNALR